MDYVRPLVAGDHGNDLNASDHKYTSGDPSRALIVLVHTSGAHLHPTISAAPTRVRAGTPVVFDATVPDAPAGTELHYTWSVVDGATWQGQAPTRHTFPKSGVFAVSVLVEGDDGSTGQSTTVLVSVCAKRGTTSTCSEADPGTGGPGGPTGTGGPGGPTGTNGGTGRHAGTHAHGSTDPQSPTSHPGEDGRTASGQSDGPGAGQQSTTHGAPRHQSGDQRGGTKTGQAVSGQLLAASAAFVVPEKVPTVTAALAPTKHTDPHWAWQWKWTAILLLPLLVGLGMAGESLQLRRRLARMGA
jgi:hypothetical protein